MASRRRFVSFALAACALALLPRCTSFGGADTIAEDADVGARLPPADAAIVADGATPLPRPEDASADTTTKSDAPTIVADYVALGSSIPMTVAPPYAFLEAAAPRIFTLAPATSTAAEVGSTTTWPIDVATPSFAMLKVTNTNLDEGVRQQLVTVALSANGNEQFGGKNADGDGARNEGTAVAVAGGYVYFARTDGGGANLEVLEQRVNLATLRIDASTRVYQKNNDAIAQSFAVSPDRLTLARIDVTDSRTIRVHRRADVASSFGAPTTATVFPPLDITDAIIGFSGTSFYAYRRNALGTFVVVKYDKR